MNTHPGPTLSAFARGLTAETAFDVLAVAKKLQAAGKDVIALQIGDSPFPSTASAVTAAKASSDAPPSPPPVAKEPELDLKAQFVKFLHEDACRRFGTVLGPDANAAHKDHFHLDMKTRRRGFCE